MNVYQSIFLTKRAFKGEVVDGGTPNPDPEPPVPETFDWYVAKTGNDSNAGTSASPFLTVQKAADVAQPGDRVGIMSGTYRETITLPRSGTAGALISFEEIPGQEVYISGFNEVGTTGWAVHSGQIYKKTITLPVNGFDTRTTRPGGNSNTENSNTIIFANQIVRNDEMMFEARWPKISSIADLMTWTKYRQLSYPTFGVNSLPDSTLPIAAPGLIGATLISNGWFMTESRTITGHSGNTISYAGIWSASGTGQWPRKAYYLTGKLALLTQAKEWHYESGTLYFWQPGGGTPTGTIEYKARNWAFDGRGRSYIKIKGLRFRGADPFWGNTSSHNITVDRTKAKYNNHWVRVDIKEWPGFGMSKIFGTKLIGNNCTFTNNEWEIMGMGVWLGEAAVCFNNLMHDIGYPGEFTQPISLWNTSGNQVITYNTIYNTGRSCFDFGFNLGGTSTSGQSLNVEFAYNHIYNFGMICGDLGATYTWGQRILTGMNHHHNWIHDHQQRLVIGEGGGISGIYFDQASGGGKIHHNVIWNAGIADIYHETTNKHRTTGTQFDIYNNTLDSNTGIEPSSDSSYRTYVASPLDRLRNNIHRRKNVVAWIAGYNGDSSNSIYTGTNALFVGGDRNVIGGLAYLLQAGSPARGIGLGSFTGVTGTIDSDTDAGAYQYGDPDPWVPGYTAIVDNPEIPDEFYIDNISTANVYVGVWTHVTNAAWTQLHINKTLSFSYEVNATLTTSFTGNKVEWYAEKRVNHGIVAVSIDGGAETMVDLYENVTTNVSSMVFSAVLAQGTHTIRLRLTSTPNPSATENNATHDAFKIFANEVGVSVLASGTWSDTLFYDDNVFYKDS